MTFTCTICNFSSSKLSLYNRHCIAKIHLEKEEKKLLCYVCNKYFKTKKSYKAHKINFHDKNNINNKPEDNKPDDNKLDNNKLDAIKNSIDNINDNINNKINDVKEEIKEEINDVKEEIHNSKKEVVTVVNKAINKASSLIKYLMENHRSVPPLKKITKEQCIPVLRLDYKCPEKVNDYSLQQLFIRDYKRNLFIPNISKSILKIRIR